MDRVESWGSAGREYERVCDDARETHFPTTWEALGRAPLNANARGAEMARSDE